METDVSKTPLTHESYERIKKDILTGSIPSGSVLSERALAERYQLSCTPLRVALPALESEGVIERLAQGTALVRHVLLEQFFDIVEMRRVLEVETASRDRDPEAARSAMESHFDGVRTRYLNSLTNG